MAVTSVAPPRRRAILDVTFRHLVDHGFEGLRIREIAEAVGINQATLLYHFPDKEELIVAVIDDIIERVRANNLRIDVRQNSFSAFEKHLRAIGELVLSAPEISIALNEISVRANRHPKIAATLTAYQQDWLDYIKTLLRAAAPGAKPAALDAAASVTLAFVLGLRIHASSTGALATLSKRGKGRIEAARRIRSHVDAFCSLVRSSLGN